MQSALPENTTSQAQYWLNKGIEILTDFGPKVIAALLIWIVGSWVIRKILSITAKLMDKRNYEATLQGFLSNLLKGILTLILVLTILGTLGVETTSFAAVIAAAGLAIGLALQGSLSNFAGGVMLLIFKPFKVGDTIEAQGIIGTVKEIQLFTTKVVTGQKKLAILPNGALSNGNIINFTTEGMLRIDHTVGIGYDSDLKNAKEVLLNVMLNNPNVLETPEPTVAVSALADSAVNLIVRGHSNTEQYWNTYYETLEAIKIALDQAEIEIPYPHSVEIQKNA